MNTKETFFKKFNLCTGCNKPLLEVSNINRTIMAETLAELNLNVGVEVGVAEGFHASVLCKSNPNIDLSLVDIWHKYPGYEEYGDPEACFENAQKTLSIYNTRFIRKFSVHAALEFADNSLDFVYIDGGHDFENVTIDICNWSKKVRPGGVVFGHDFKISKRRTVDVTYVVKAFCEAKNIKPLLVLKNDIRDPHFGPDNPGWMFIREETNTL